VEDLLKGKNKDISDLGKKKVDGSLWNRGVRVFGGCELHTGWVSRDEGWAVSRRATLQRAKCIT
jgi:hypothetical protein